MANYVSHPDTHSACVNICLVDPVGSLLAKIAHTIYFILTILFSAEKHDAVKVLNSICKQLIYMMVWVKSRIPIRKLQGLF